MDQIEKITESKNRVYSERNKLVLFLASMFPSGIKRTDIPGWHEDWHNCVYVDTPEGQMSWHYHISDFKLFEHLPQYKGEWDGHTTEQKYQRLDILSRKFEYNKTGNI